MGTAQITLKQVWTPFSEAVNNRSVVNRAVGSQGRCRRVFSKVYGQPTLMKYTASSWLAESVFVFIFPTAKAIVLLILTETLQGNHGKSTQWPILTAEGHYQCYQWLTKYPQVDRRDANSGIFIESSTMSLCFRSGSGHCLQVAWKWLDTVFPQRDSTQGIFSFHFLCSPGFWQWCFYAGSCGSEQEKCGSRVGEELEFKEFKESWGSSECIPLQEWLCMSEERTKDWERMRQHSRQSCAAAPLQVGNSVRLWGWH